MRDSEERTFDPMIFITPDGSRETGGGREPVDLDLWNRWVNASHEFAKIEPMLEFGIQSLGRLDARLQAEWERFEREIHGSSPNDDEIHRFSDNYFDNYLWVLAAYETTRTLDQRFRETPSLARGLTADLTEVKRVYERIRVPLAKMEASRRNPSDDSIPFPATSPGAGIGWRLAEDEYVTRRQLADILLRFLERWNGPPHLTTARTSA